MTVCAEEAGEETLCPKLPICKCVFTPSSFSFPFWFVQASRALAQLTPLLRASCTLATSPLHSKCTFIPVEHLRAKKNVDRFVSIATRGL